MLYSALEDVASEMFLKQKVEVRNYFAASFFPWVYCLNL